MGLQRYMGTGYAGSGYANSKTFAPTTHAEGATVYDANNEIAGVWKNGALQKPTYNPQQGPLSIQAMTGAQQQPFKYETPAPAAAPAASEMPSNPVGAFGQGVSANQGRWDELYRNAVSRKNPYADGQSLLASIRQSEDAISAHYPNAQRRAREGMAARGMMGSGQELSAMNALNAEQANAYSSAENALRSQFADKSNAWQQQQDSAIMQVLNGQFGALGGYVTQAELPGRLEGQGLQNQVSQLQIDEARATLPSIIMKVRAGAQLTAEEARQAKWANDNAGVLAAAGLAANILGAAGQAAASYYGMKG